MIVKVHKKDNKTMAVAVDADLLGRKFEEGDTQLDLTSDFYKGEDMDDAHAGDVIRNADMVHLIGEQAVKLGIAEGIIDETHVKKIDGIPHALGLVIVD